MRLLIFLFCLFSFFPCYSKWEKFRENKLFTEYFEVDSIKKVNGIIYVWSMIDYTEAKEDGNLSTKYYSKYDCKKKKYKIITIVNYKTNMGKGRDFKYSKNITSESNDSDWIFPLVKEDDYVKLRFLCN